MRYNIKRDLKLRQKFANSEERYRSLRSLYVNSYIDSEVREIARIDLQKISGLRTKIVNRCVLTGRSRGILRKFKVSRLTFKELASTGVIVGIKKSSW